MKEKLCEQFLYKNCNVLIEKLLGASTGARHYNLFCTQVCVRVMSKFNVKQFMKS